jgi:hypothetical protein
LHQIQQGSSSSVPSVTPASTTVPPAPRGAHATPPAPSASAPGPRAASGPSAPGPRVITPTSGPPQTATRFKPPRKSAQAGTSTATITGAKIGRKRAASSVPSYSYFTCSGNN